MLAHKSVSHAVLLVMEISRMNAKTIGMYIAVGLVSFIVACVVMLFFGSTWKESIRLAVLALSVSPVITYQISKMSPVGGEEK